MSSEQDRRVAATRLARYRWRNATWDRRIDQYLRSTLQRANEASWLNSVCGNLDRYYPALRWLAVVPLDFTVVDTVGQYARLCYDHMVPVEQAHRTTLEALGYSGQELQAQVDQFLSANREMAGEALTDDGCLPLESEDQALFEGVK